jgi:hypothetical protein
MSILVVASVLYIPNVIGNDGTTNPPGGGGVQGRFTGPGTITAGEPQEGSGSWRFWTNYYLVTLGPGTGRRNDGTRWQVIAIVPVTTAEGGGRMTFRIGDFEVENPPRTSVFNTRLKII